MTPEEAYAKALSRILKRRSSKILKGSCRPTPVTVRSGESDWCMPAVGHILVVVFKSRIGKFENMGVFVVLVNSLNYREKQRYKLLAIKSCWLFQSDEF